MPKTGVSGCGISNLLKYMQLVYTADGASAEYIYNIDSKGNVLWMI